MARNVIFAAQSSRPIPPQPSFHRTISPTPPPARAGQHSSADGSEPSCWNPYFRSHLLHRESCTLYHRSALALQQVLLQATDAARFLCQRDVESPAQYGFTSACAASACSWPRAPQTGPRSLDPAVTKCSTCCKRHQRRPVRREPSYASSFAARDTHGLEYHSSRRRSPTVTIGHAHGLESDTTRTTTTSDIDRALCQLERCKR